MSRCLDRRIVIALLALGGALELSGSRAVAQILSEPLFATPFVVEHHVVHSRPDGSTSATAPVTDYYGGSWIVSVRPDGSRLIVDFTRREVTEVRPAASTYATLGFERLAELNRRLHAAGDVKQAAVKSTSAPIGARQVKAASSELIQVQRLPDSDGAVHSLHATGAGGQSVIRLKVTASAAEGSLEVWCDPRVKLSQRARSAVAELETDVLGDPAVPASAATMLAAARGYAEGAFPVRTIRKAGGAARAQTIEDVATRLEPLARAQMDLVKVPDGYRRVPHPLEVMVAFVEEEASRAPQSRAGH
jgi:hypothetical protein